MVLIIKKFVKIFKDTDNVPKKYKNLRKNKHVKTFSRPFLNIPEILVNEYGLTREDKIIVFHMKEVDRKDWKGYRTPFKKLYYGSVKDLRAYLKNFLETKVWKRKKVK